MLIQKKKKLKALTWSSMSSVCKKLKTMDYTIDQFSTAIVRNFLTNGFFFITTWHQSELSTSVTCLYQNNFTSRPKMSKKLWIWIFLFKTIHNMHYLQQTYEISCMPRRSMKNIFLPSPPDMVKYFQTTLLSCVSSYL